MAVEFGILGPLEVRRDGREVEVGATRQRALLALLLIHANRVVPIDRLVDDLWGAEAPARATNAVQVYVSALRRVLEPDRPARGPSGVLLTRPPGYLLQVTPDRLDLLRFERLVDQGRRASEAGDPATARVALAEALSLWRGPALADFAYERFAEREAARLEELRLQASEARVDADLAVGHHADVVAELESLAVAEPLRERLSGQLMLALYRCGRQAEALRAYQRLRRVLSEELGIEPSSVLQNLEQAILLQKPELDWAPAGATRTVSVSETKYARTRDGVHIAYQCSGTGSIDLLELSTFVNSIAAPLDYPGLHRWLRRVGSFARHVRYDRRGIGVSDPAGATGPPTLEQWADDALAVLDALELQKATLVGLDQVSGLACALLAGTCPHRVDALVLLNTSARLAWAPDNPWGFPAEAQARLEARIERAWPDAFPIEVLAPSAAADPQLRSAWQAMALVGASPAAAIASSRVIFESDIRHVLPAIRVPTLVLHSAEDRLCPVEHGRYLAKHIPGAKFVELPGGDHVFTDALTDPLADEIEEFLTGERKPIPLDRVLTTVLFTDIVGSTAHASALGDRAWRERLDAHDAMVRRQLQPFRGREIKTTGDGFLATFDGPARAIQCGCAIRDGARQLGIEVRVGLHTGEVELRGDDIAGTAVNLGARVAGLAAGGEVLVSRTVTDLVAGSGIAFEDRGDHALKGVPGQWRLFAVVGTGARGQGA